MTEPSWEEMCALAGQFDCLSLGGGMQRTAALADRVRSSLAEGTFSLQELQVCLSFECRSLQHCGMVPQGDDLRYLAALYARCKDGK